MQLDSGPLTTPHRRCCGLIVPIVRRNVTVHGPAGDWSIFRREDVFCEKNVGQKMNLSTSAIFLSFHNLYNR